MLSTSWNTYRNTFKSSNKGNKILQDVLSKGTAVVLTIPSPELDELRDPRMAPHELRKHASPDSASSATLHSHLNKDLKHVDLPQPLETGSAVPQDRALLADPEKQALLSAATRIDLNESVGTVLSGVQLSALRQEQLDELALLVTERGVVFLRGQDLTPKGQAQLVEYYGTRNHALVSAESSQGQQEILQEQNGWHAEASHETSPPSYLLLSIREGFGAGAETTWISQYGVYDALSKHMQRFVTELSAVYASQGLSSNHPAVCTHPVTGLRALNVTPGLVTGFAELQKKESDKFLEILEFYMHSAVEHSVRWKWEAGSVAMWDNRCTAYRHILGTEALQTFGLKSSFLRQKISFDPSSESREERRQRLAKEAKEEKERIAEIKAHYNNTPLRRILSRQLSLEVNVPNEALVFQPVDKSSSPVDSVISGLDQEADVSAVESRERRTERWTHEVHDDLYLEKQVPVPVQKSNTPLTRILERQLSSSLDRRLDLR